MNQDYSTAAYIKKSRTGTDRYGILNSNQTLTKMKRTNVMMLTQPSHFKKGWVKTYSEENIIKTDFIINKIPGLTGEDAPVQFFVPSQRHKQNRNINNDR
ncbi:hypothetical protein [Flammeovirga pacifica]|uniref:Uncharacterized protein n=1 Tax=Flammeovirga pacifica TaxID=915059 RepID=A0A1S1YU77_FLAPC|nr:hypothetical protein [Flammeovirga pacifica]OHX64581.1 hypothetical protein NH26_23705 [Flammeovirga pacifica]